MASFVDADGVSWRIEIDGFLMRRIKQETGFNVCDLIGSEQSLAMLLQDLETSIDTLWLCVEEQAISRNIDDEAFGKGLKGDSLGDAFQALLSAVVDFFPSEEQRKAARTILDTAERLGERILEKTVQVIVGQAEATFTAHTGDTQESSESTD